MSDRICKYCNAPLKIKLCEIPSKFARRNFCNKSCSCSWRSIQEVEKAKSREPDPPEDEIYRRAEAIRDGWDKSRYRQQRPKPVEVLVVPEPRL